MISVTWKIGYLPVHQVRVLVLELRLEVVVGETVALQLVHLLLQIADLLREGQRETKLLSAGQPSRTQAIFRLDQTVSDCGNGCKVKRSNWRVSKSVQAGTVTGSRLSIPATALLSNVIYCWWQWHHHGKRRIVTAEGFLQIGEKNILFLLQLELIIGHCEIHQLLISLWCLIILAVSVHLQ